MLGFLLQFCPSSLSYSFLFPWHGKGSKCTGPGVFGIPGMEALLSFSICRKRDMLCWERGVPSLVRVSPVEQPPESGYGLCQCLASSETKIVSRKDWGPSVVCPSCLSQACCCICCLSTPPLLTRLENTSQIVQILWITFSPPMCFYSWNYDCTFFSLALHEMAKTTELGQRLQTERSWRNYVFYVYAEYRLTCWSCNRFHMVKPRNKTVFGYFL